MLTLMIAFCAGFVLGMACEYWLQTRPKRHIREAEAETAWDNQVA